MLSHAFYEVLKVNDISSSVHLEFLISDSGLFSSWFIFVYSSLRFVSECMSFLTEFFIDTTNDVGQYMY